MATANLGYKGQERATEMFKSDSYLSVRNVRFSTRHKSGSNDAPEIWHVIGWDSALTRKAQSTNKLTAQPSEGAVKFGNALVFPIPEDHRFSDIVIVSNDSIGEPLITIQLEGSRSHTSQIIGAGGAIKFIGQITFNF